MNEEQVLDTVCAALRGEALPLDWQWSMPASNYIHLTAPDGSGFVLRIQGGA